MFYAHSVHGLPEEEWETVTDHLFTVGGRAGQLAEKFGARQLGEVSGLSHDFGKFHPDFLSRLRGSVARFDHSAFGAAQTASMQPPRLGRMLSYLVAGHHAGLANGRRGTRSEKRTPLSERIEAVEGQLALVVANAARNGTILPSELHAPTAMAPRSGKSKGFTSAFLVRMLFSCLVDADYTCTEEFFATKEGRKVRRGDYPDLVSLERRLSLFLAGVQSVAPRTAVNDARAEVLTKCHSSAALKPGLFTLTVPTGGGKTFASAAFALQHAVRHGLDRVIVVVPFTSVIEQTAAALRNALGDDLQHAVVEHHSSFDESKGLPAGRDKLRLAIENWDTPIIVTTSVQFFESLFSGRTSKCRKLHNISRSVIILDEAQTLPIALLRPILMSLDELVRNYRTSVVLATATQPALDDRQARTFDGLAGARELCPDIERMFRTLRRVEIRHIGVVDDDALETKIRDEDQILTIVNTKRHARVLFERIRDLQGSYHLSTSMCAVHRTAVIAEIKHRLKSGLPCRVISTAVIEAGVDVDFPSVMRADAGLDQIAQAAGRCNREGRMDRLGSVEIFTPADGHMLRELAGQVDVARGLVRRIANGTIAGDLLDPSVINAFFSELFWTKGAEGLDQHGILELLETAHEDVSYPFETVENLFKMIDDGMPLVVPFGWDRDHVASLAANSDALTFSRFLQRHTVTVPRSTMSDLQTLGKVGSLLPEQFGDQFVVLEDSFLYDTEAGFAFDSGKSNPCSCVDPKDSI